MRAFVLAIAFALPAATALEARQSTTRLSCAAAGNLVSSSRAIVLDTGPGTYDRFVSDRGQCLGQETIRPAWAATRDNPQCVVGFVCIPREGRRF